VLVPTRELAAQVTREVVLLTEPTGLRVTAVYGGTKYEPQRRALRRGADIVVATPGRLEDLVARRDIKLDDVDIVVVDEADRMADMGFLPAVRRILDATRPTRQTLLFSATLDGDVDVVIRRYQREPRFHDVTVSDDGADVDHSFVHAAKEERVGLTARLVHRHDRAIVFCRTRHGADRLTRQLRTSGVTAVAIHGNRTQAQRQRALDDFAAGRAQALVATDVAARGIHVDAVGCVVHFDPAADAKDYLHRSGRTGRAGATGTVVTLVAEDQRRAVATMRRTLGLGDSIERPAKAPRPSSRRRGNSRRPRR
jgi:superfamily II DNA/RNA helicase